MGSKERFPALAKAIRLIGATVVPGLFLLLLVGYFMTGRSVVGSLEGLQPLGIDRVIFVGILALFVMGIGVFCGEIAYPHSAAVPASLGALMVAALGVLETMDGFDRWGSFQLGGFLLLFVMPGAYLLGALLRQRRRRRKEEAS